MLPQTVGALGSEGSKDMKTCLCDGEVIRYALHIFGLTGIKSCCRGGRAGWVAGHICI